MSRPVDPIRPYLGVKTVCGGRPGANSVLLPLPLFERNPCAPLPGRMKVSIDPRWPVTKAGPLDVKIVCPTDDDDEPRRATGVAETDQGSAPRADAWTAAPASKAIAATATVFRMMRESSVRDLTMS